MHLKNVPVCPSWPDLHHKPPPAADNEARCLEGHTREMGCLPGPAGQPVMKIFRIEGLVCCMALASVRPSRSALHHGSQLTGVMLTTEVILTR